MQRNWKGTEVTVPEVEVERLVDLVVVVILPARRSDAHAAPLWTARRPSLVFWVMSWALGFMRSQAVPAADGTVAPQATSQSDGNVDIHQLTAVAADSGSTGAPVRR